MKTLINRIIYLTILFIPSINGANALLPHPSALKPSAYSYTDWLRDTKEAVIDLGEKIARKKRSTKADTLNELQELYMLLNKASDIAASQLPAAEISKINLTLQRLSAAIKYF